MKPVGGRCVIERIKKEQGPIIVEENDDEMIRRGKVIASDYDEVKEGMVVLYNKIMADELEGFDLVAGDSILAHEYSF